MKLRQEARIFSGIIDGKQMEETPEALKVHLKWKCNQIFPPEDVEIIGNAYDLAYESHRNQARKSGEPYIIHPLWVGIILAELELDKETIMAGLLHDVVEDTDVTYEDIVRDFGEEIAVMVDGVTKLGKLKYAADKLDVQAENLRKMFLAMAKDIRVILIKLADRLHNMRTLQFMTPEKQKEKARETMDIYAPIAGRLGISMLKVELDDLSMKYLYPDIYAELVEQVGDRAEAGEDFINGIITDVGEQIEQAGISCRIYGRVKHYFSIYKKMVNKGLTLDEIMDLFATRILVDDVKDCYAVLGLIHEMYTPIPGKFKDYIAMPKPNHYQALHTSVMSHSGQPFEVQIRTFEMHKTAEYGIAAHWKYKESGGSNEMVSTGGGEARLSWLREILEWQQELEDNKEFMTILKSDLNLFSENVYCFTPQGDVKSLPSGSTAVDFAYAIHSAVGNKMVGARVNGRLVTIDYPIQNGDRIEIMTSPNSKGPSRDWLKFVKSSSARTKINQWFKKEFKEENIVRGKDMLLSYCRTHGIDLNEDLTDEVKTTICKKYGFGEWDALLAAIGHGGLKEGAIANRIAEEKRKKAVLDITDDEILRDLSVAKTSHSKSNSNIIVSGVEDVEIHLSGCCKPIPGDDIIGYITRGNGVSGHRAECENLKKLIQEDGERIIKVEWNNYKEDADRSNFVAHVIVYANNRSGLIVDVSRILAEKNIDIRTMEARTSKKGISTLELTFEIKSKDELNRIIEVMRNIESVIQVTRSFS